MLDENDPDYEGEFYKLLALLDPSDFMLDIKKDTFDASVGPQIGLTAEGHVGILMVVNQPTAKMILDAMNGVLDHNCAAGTEAVMGYMMYTHALLKSILPRLECGVQETAFFEHEGGES